MGGDDEVRESIYRGVGDDEVMVTVVSKIKNLSHELKLLLFY